MHPGDVRAPEQTPRPKRVEHAMQRIMDARKRISVRRVARLTRLLYRHVGRFRQRDELIEMPNERLRFPRIRLKRVLRLLTDLRQRAFRRSAH
jgi:hypothetical protein